MVLSITVGTRQYHILKHLEKNKVMIIDLLRLRYIDKFKLFIAIRGLSNRGLIRYRIEDNKIIIEKNGWSKVKVIKEVKPNKIKIWIYT